MSNFVTYYDQIPINLDHFCSFHITLNIITFSRVYSVNGSYASRWEFETKEKAKEVYEDILLHCTTHMGD